MPPQRSGLLECHSEWTQELWGLSLYFQGKLVKNFFIKKKIRLALSRIHPFLLPLFFILKTCRRWRKEDEIRGRERRRCKMFLFCKDTVSSQRVQGYASEAVSCWALCCLFDASQLITLPVESYSLSASLNSKHNHPVCTSL